MFSSRFMLFPTFKKKKFGVVQGRGVGVSTNFYKNNSFSFHFAFYAIFNIKKIGTIEKCPFTYWLNGRWFLQIVDWDSWNLYPIYPLFPCSDFLSQMWGWLGGGGMFFLHFMLFPTFLEKQILGIKKYLYYKNSFSFNVLFVVFL